MTKLKEKIFIKQWLNLKPYNNQTLTDTYYLKLCNEVKQSCINDKQSLVLSVYLNNDEIDLLACFLTSYFEDLISETNIWNSFIKNHKKLYGKPLPFYETIEYYEQEINFQDVCFLIWYYINSIQKEKFIAPYNDFILRISEKVMDVFEDEWEYAPVNVFLKTFYSIDEGETDYYKARYLIDNVLFKTYLFFPDTQLDFLDEEFKIIEDHRDDSQLPYYIKGSRDEFLHDTFTRLLGFKGAEWVANIIGEDHNLSKDYLKISKKINSFFFYKGQDEKNIFLEHIASGKKFDLTKESIDDAESFKEIDTILLIGIVNWKNEWWFSGIYLNTEFDSNLVLNEKKSIRSKNAVSFLDHENKDMDEVLEKQLKAFKKFNNNQIIAFLSSDNINSFMKAYIEFFNDSLKLTKKQREEAKKRSEEEGHFEKEDNDIDFDEMSESGLIFFNNKSGLEVAMGLNSAFPTKTNPFYNKKDSEQHIWQLIFSDEISTELVMYCVDNFKKDLSFFEKEENKFILNNLDFLLRFWKRGTYFTKPSITFTGGQK